jgi:hypothetical protein
MPILTFDSQVLSSFGTPPANLTYSLSGGSFGYKTVELRTVGTTDSKQVVGVAFNSLTAPGSGNGVFTTLSAFNGTTLRVDTAYIGTTFALVYQDRSSSLFTVISTGPTTRQTLTANGFDTVTPEFKRLWTLGYI